MDIAELKTHLNNLSKSLSHEDHQLLMARLNGLVSAHPFNEYEYILMFLQDKKVINFGDYEKLRGEYISTKKYLELFGLSPRVFGEIWAHKHIMDIDSSFKRPSKILNGHYTGEYDLWLDNIKVEVKACRAINTKVRGELISKALEYASMNSFWMNFQQLKPNACDVFIFIGIWVDKIVYWVLSSNEVENSPYKSHQHRGGIEYQIGITESNISTFDKYKVEALQLATTIRAKAR